jgi:pterin-4a-carbinolamine dehydratase
MTKCEPCETLQKSHLLTEEEVSALLQAEELLPRWKIGRMELAVEESSSTHILFLSRKFTAKNFQAAMNYFNQTAAIAEREGHHPDFVSEIVTFVCIR